MKEALKRAMEKLLTEALGEPVTIQGQQGLGGGCINHASQLMTNRGAFFCKWNQQGPADMFLREAECLEELSKARSSLVIPQVVVKTKPDNDLPAILITDFLQPASTQTSQQDEILGRGIAELHQYQQQAFGFYHDNYCGSTPQNNAWNEDWVSFFGKQRIGHLIRLIEKKRALSSAEKNAYERLIERLSDWIGHQPEASLNHGDLWSGNHMYTLKGPALIDPASYYADREFDLAMMAMFGGYADRVWEAYQEAFPLPAEWKERRSLYMLYHYLNHYYLFGGSYGQQAWRIAQKYAG